MREAKPRQCLDAKKKPLNIGQAVESIPPYTNDGTIVQGVVKKLLTTNAQGGGIVAVEHLDGERKGQVWRSASFLWVGKV